MMRLKHTSDTARDWVDLGRIVQPGEIVDVDDDILAKRLLEQVDRWAKAPADKKTKENG